MLFVTTDSSFLNRRNPVLSLIQDNVDEEEDPAGLIEYFARRHKYVQVRLLTEKAIRQVAEKLGVSDDENVTETATPIIEMTQKELEKKLTIL